MPNYEADIRSLVIDRVLAEVGYPSYYRRAEHGAGAFAPMPFCMYLRPRLGVRLGDAYAPRRGILLPRQHRQEWDAPKPSILLIQARGYPSFCRVHVFQDSSAAGQQA